MNELTTRFQTAASSDSLIQLVLSHPFRDHAEASPESDKALLAAVEKIVVRPVELKSGRSFQFTYGEARRETHRNLPLDEAVGEVERLITGLFRRGHLFTTEFDFTVKVKASGKVRAHQFSPSRQKAAPTDHNRKKQYLIPDGTPCEFLQEIGVMTADGNVRKQKFDKFRQINRYLEFVEDVYESFPNSGPIRVVDFGCGKSYLTFALHHLLNRIHGRKVDIVGLDLKADVVEHCNEIASKLGCDGLRFESGDMAGYSPLESVDLSVSLHACDKATDVALARAVEWNAKVIFAVPCCHHEVASKLKTEFLSPIMRRGILKERFAELLTDSLRADLLEGCGYRTQVLEFISLEHTPKNILIRATQDSAVSSPAIPESVKAVRSTFGLEPCELERLLVQSICPEQDSAT
ncbi:MAG: SAM-dependent methyltransferase [Planctomycetaceae bacterium]|jgi:SAM-dependent methyltransferase|nr:SAM-dependent methyltransferase [Planctomycetaceae bacterium]